MKIKNIFICIAAALLVTACGTTEIAKREYEHREAVIKLLADHQKKTEESIRESANRQAIRLVDLKIEQEKTKQAEASAKVVQAGSLQIIAAKAGKEGAAAIGAVLASGLNSTSSNTAVAQADFKIEIPQVPPLKLPEFAPIKTPAQDAKEWGGLILGAVASGFNPVFGYLSAKSNNAANVAINKDNRAADAANYANLMGTFTSFSQNHSNTAIAAVNAARDSSIEFAKQPKVTINNEGDNNNFALFDSQANHTRKRCDQNQNQVSQSGNSGQVTPSGNSGNATSSAQNAPAQSGNTTPTGTSGTTGNVSPVQSANCVVN